MPGKLILKTPGQIAAMERKLLVFDETGVIQDFLRACNWEFLELTLATFAEPEQFSPTVNTLYVALVSDNAETCRETIHAIALCEFEFAIVVVSKDRHSQSLMQGAIPFSVCLNSDISHQFIQQLFVIAEQATVIKQLRHESHCYREMVDSCPDYVFVRDKENKIVFANAAIAALHEIKPLEMVGKTYAELTGDVEGGKKSAIQDAEIFESGKPFYQHEDFYQDESGSIQWNRVSKKRIADSTGTNHFILGVATDLTEWKRKEVELQESENRYRVLYVREQVLGKISDTISGTSEIAPMLERVARMIPELFDTDIGGIENRDSRKRLVVSSEQGEVSLSSALEALADTQKNYAVFKGEDESSIAAASIKSDQNNEHTLYALRPFDVEPFTEQDAELLGAIGKQCLLSITKIALHKKIEHQANHDSLTGLPNRLQYEKSLKLQLSESEFASDAFSVVFLDLDGFKLINDSYGHLVGDKVLQLVAERFSFVTSGLGMLARMGGDEFSFLLPSCRTREEAQKFAESILQQLRQEIRISVQRFSVSASIGIALYPEDGSEISELMRRADSAMYHAKYASSDSVAFFNKEIEAREVRRLRLENDLASALNSDELELHFQPQINLTTRTLIGVESLSRWNHPELGFISPDEFIAIAEQSHLIHDLGWWVITTAFKQVKYWQECGYKLKTAINLSPKQFDQPEFTDDFIAKVEHYGISANSIEVEVTESTLMNDLDSVSQTLQVFRDRGISVAIDDFGTGYSSLGYLHHLPLDILKIDRSFVGAMNLSEPEKCLLGVISHMAKGFGLTTIVEGVETLEQVEATTSIGCDIAQGWYFARAMPAAEVEPLIRDAAKAAQDALRRAA